jgi:hypothetical protein
MNVPYDRLPGTHFSDQSPDAIKEIRRLLLDGKATRRDSGYSSSSGSDVGLPDPAAGRERLRSSKAASNSSSVIDDDQP